MDALQLRNANCFRNSWAGMWTASVVCCAISMAASDRAIASTYQTRNFSVSATTPEIAEQVGQAAESYRHDLAVFWLGKPLPNWSKPCRIRVKEGSLGAGGQTTFQFSGGEVYNWNMYVQGSLERILDSVLPHEINHTIFACHFRRPLPRWADEGAATLFEDRSEQLKQLFILNGVIKDRSSRFSLLKLMSMKEYPKQHQSMLILYAQGYALVDFLIQQKGRQTYLRFLADGETIGWEEAIRKNFDHAGIESLERNWESWVIAGMPSLVHPSNQAAETESVAIRSQSPDESSTGRQTARNSSPKNTQLVGEAVNSSLLATSKTTAARVQGSTRNAVGNSSADTGSNPVVRKSAEQAEAVLEKRPEVKAASNEHLATPRRASIQAPRPTAGVASGLQNETQETSDSETQPGQTVSQVERVDRDAGPIVGTVSDRSTPFFESVSIKSGEKRVRESRIQASLDNDRPETLMPTSSEQTESDSKTADDSDSSMVFESVHLPRERNEVSGATPQWAGFPGQKQSF